MDQIFSVPKYLFKGKKKKSELICFANILEVEIAGPTISFETLDTVWKVLEKIKKKKNLYPKQLLYPHPAYIYRHLVAVRRTFGAVYESFRPNLHPFSPLYELIHKAFLSFLFF